MLATYDHSAKHVWQAEHAVRLLDPQPGQLILDIASGTALGRPGRRSLGWASTGVVGIGVSAQMWQGRPAHLAPP